MIIRTYTELRHYVTFEERFDYLSLDGVVGEATFGTERYLNQKFYHSSEWRDVRSFVRSRDLGFDLGAEDRPIRGTPLVHHMNPLTITDVIEVTKNLLDPEFLICTSHATHNAIHYGDKRQLPRPFVERKPGDTAPWRT